MLKKIHQHKNWVILADQGIFSGASFLTTILIARNLDPVSFGIYSGLLLGLYLAVSILGSLIIQPLQVNVAQAEDQSYVSFSFWSQLIMVLLISAVLFVSLNYLPFDHGISFRFIPFALGFAFQDYFRKLFLALDKPLNALLTDTLAVAAQLSALIFLLVSGSANLEKTITYLGLAYLPSFLFGLWMLRPLHIELGKWKKYLVSHIKQGRWLLMTVMVQWWAGNLFVVASGLYLGVEALGALRLVQTLFGVLNVLLQTFENYVLPQTARKLSENALTARRYILTTGKKAGLVFMPVLVIIFLFSEYIIVLAGGDAYAGYGYLLRGMAVLYVLIFINQPLRIAIRVLILNRYFLYGYLLSLVFAMISSAYLLSNFGLMGAIAGLAGSQLILIIFWQSVLHAKKFFTWKSFISY